MSWIGFMAILVSFITKRQHFSCYRHKICTYINITDLSGLSPTWLRSYLDRSAVRCRDMSQTMPPSPLILPPLCPKPCSPPLRRHWQRLWSGKVLGHQDIKFCRASDIDDDWHNHKKPLESKLLQWRALYFLIQGQIIHIISIQSMVACWNRTTHTNPSTTALIDT